jgi:hypothetical protein
MIDISIAIVALVVLLIILVGVVIAGLLQFYGPEVMLVALMIWIIGFTLGMLVGAVDVYNRK